MNRIRLGSPLAVTGALIVTAALAFAISATVWLPGWWLSGLIVIDAELAMVGALLILMPRMRIRRAQAEVVEHMLPACLDLDAAAYELERLRVWPQPGATVATSTDPAERLREIADRVHQASHCVAFLPDPARPAGNKVIAAAEGLDQVITDIRATTKQGYQGQIDRRVVDDHTRAVAAMATAREEFRTAIRAFVVRDPWSGLARLLPRVRRASSL